MFLEALPSLFSVFECAAADGVGELDALVFVQEEGALFCVFSEGELEACVSESERETMLEDLEGDVVGGGGGGRVGFAQGLEDLWRATPVDLA